MNKKLALIIIVVSILISSCGVIEKPQLTLVDNSQAMGVILLPEKTELEKLIDSTAQSLDEASRSEAVKLLEGRWNANQVGSKTSLQDEELLAANELQEFIKKISGATLEIRRVTATHIPDTPALLIGTELAKAQGYGNEMDQLDNDALLLVTKGNKIIITGRRARGTLYAAYSFLESLGVRWVMPGEFGEIYPDKQTIATSINITENPSHTDRYWWNAFDQGEEFSRWTLRNKANFVKAIGDKRVNQSHALARPLEWGAKNLKYGIEVKEYKRDPETGAYLKNEDGDRIYESVYRLPEGYYAIYNNEINYNTPNMSNPEVWDLYAAYYIDWFKKNPEQDYVSMSAEDEHQQDSRSASRAISSMEYDLMQGVFSATDRLWFFHNRVIEKVVRVFPEKKFGVVVYGNNTLAPRLERVHPNMALIYAPLSVCPLHDIRDEKCKTNKIYRESLEAWAQQARAVGTESYYYDYFPMGFEWNVTMICPQWAIIGKNYPYLHKLGLTGHTDSGFDDWGASHFNNWMAIRLYWNADQDYKEVLADYCKIRYGKAAPAVIEYCNILENRMDEIPDLTANEAWGNHLILTSEVRKACRKALKKASGMVKGEREKAHLETLIDMQVSTDAWCDGIEIAREEGDFARAMQVMEKSFEIQEKLNQLYSHFVSPYTVNKEDLDLARIFPGGWYNKYKSFDKKIKSSASHVMLPRFMKVTLDTDNTAWAKGWHKPEVPVAGLENWDITMVPDIKYQTQREVSAFFYRCEVDMPSDFNSGRATIFFPSIIARALQIWINGEPVMFTHDGYEDTIYRGPEALWYDYNHELQFDISNMLIPGKTNTIAFRVFKSRDHAGTYDRMFLLAE